MYKVKIKKQNMFVMLLIVNIFLIVFVESQAIGIYIYMGDWKHWLYTLTYLVCIVVYGFAFKSLCKEVKK